MKKKRVTDIVSPKEKAEKQEEREKEDTEETEETPLLIPQEGKGLSKFSVKKPKFSFPRIKFSSLKLLLGGGVVVLIFLICFFTLSKAEVQIWPETEKKNFETKVTVNTNAQSVDAVEKIIPGQLFEKEKTFTEELQATGKETLEEKATGFITVYNEYSTQDQILIATTRFVSTEGKLFRTP